MAYHLVQRCKKAWTEDPGQGFDGFFRLDYMGSSEFEWGAVPASLKRIRSTKDLVRGHRSVTFDGVTRDVWFVGSRVTLKAKVDAFEEWLAKGCRGKEATWFVENFTGRDRFIPGRLVSDFMTKTVLWWALNEDVLFALDREVADLALRAVWTPREATR